jgi:hypothetical protein
MSDKINTTVGKNKDRQNDRQPEYRGKVDKCPYCNAGPIYTSYWVKTNGTTGEKFFGGEAQKPFDKNEQSASKPAPRAPVDPLDDDIPFAPHEWRTVA